MKTILIPLEVPSQNTIGGRNWRVVAARTKARRCKWRMLVASEMRRVGIEKATGPRRIHIMAYRRQRCRDIANLIGGAKACVDGMVDAGLLVDDKDVLATITYDQGTAAQSPTGKPATVITLYQTMAEAFPCDQ